VYVTSCLMFDKLELAMSSSLLLPSDGLEGPDCKPSEFRIIEPLMGEGSC